MYIYLPVLMVSLSKLVQQDGKLLKWDHNWSTTCHNSSHQILTVTEKHLATTGMPALTIQLYVTQSKDTTALDCSLLILDASAVDCSLHCNKHHMFGTVQTCRLRMSINCHILTDLRSHMLRQKDICYLHGSHQVLAMHEGIAFLMFIFKPCFYKYLDVM